MIRPLLALLCFTATIAMMSPAHAQQGGKQPIEITADNTLEWLRAESQYVADGNAMVQQGATTIKASRIVADYRSSEKSSMDIYRLTATTNVTIDDKGNVATGDKLVYDIDTGIATLTGNNLTMTSPDQKVTATEKFEYTVAQGKVKAIGNAKVVRAADTLHADTITAFLVDDAAGKNSLDRLEGDGHVRIITATETLAGDHGVYNAKANTALITGAVEITRGKNILNGERAEVDLNTNISRLFGGKDEKSGGRVRGIFYPGDGNPAKDKTSDAPAPVVTAEALPAAEPAIEVITPPAKPVVLKAEKAKPVAEKAAKKIAPPPVKPTPVAAKTIAKPELPPAIRQEKITPALGMQSVTPLTTGAVSKAPQLEEAVQRPTAVLDELAP